MVARSRVTKSLLLAAGLPAVVLLVVSAGVAQAATIIGDDLTSSTFGANSGVTVTKAYNADGTLYPGSPVSGVLTSVRVRNSGVGSSGHVRVVRRVTAFSGGLADYLNAEASIPYTVAVFGDPVGHITTILTRRAIVVGDQLALHNTDSGTKMYYKVIAPEDCAFSFGAGAQGTNDSYNTASCLNWMPLVQGTVESDADGDGYGDETQDFCPNDPTRQGGCPVGPIADLELIEIKTSRTRLKRRMVRMYRITNLGPGKASLARLRIVKKRNLKSPTILNGACTPSTDKRSCVVPSLAPGASVDVKVRATVLNSRTGSVLASVASAATDPKPANNAARTKFRFKLRQR